ncbi:hypothetical protein D3C71_1927600 [compost metagenome]
MQDIGRCQVQGISAQVCIGYNAFIRHIGIGQPVITVCIFSSDGNIVGIGSSCFIKIFGIIRV